MCIKPSINNINNNRGFSLIEALVGVALLGIVSVAAMNLMTNMSESQNIVMSLQDVNSYESRLRKTISAETVCKFNFETKTMGGGMAVDKIDVSAGNPFYNKGSLDSEGKIKIESMNLVKQYDLSPTKAVANLNVRFKSAKGMEYLRTIPLFFALDAGGKIITCSGTGIALDMSMLQIACEISSDGKEYYDEATKKCVGYPTVKFKGTKDFAACGPGYRVINCSMSGDAYDEPDIPKTFKKGGTKNKYITEYEATANKATNTCSCDYTAALEAASPTLTCIANCVQTAFAP